VLSTFIPAGEWTAIHTHRWPSVFIVLSWGGFLRYGDQGAVLLDSTRVDAVKNHREVI